MSGQVTMNLNLFPDQVITELLIRLPAKDVCRFKSVSKRWNSIICTSHFIASYLSHCNPDWFLFNRVIQFTTESTTESDIVSLDGLSTTDESESATQFNLTPRPDISTLTLNPALISEDQPVVTDPFNPPQICGSSNGLLLCGFDVLQEVRGPSYMNYSLSWNEEEKRLFVTNPATEEWALIPRPGYLPIDMQFGVGFITRVDPGTGTVDKFLVVEYQHLVPTNTAILQCFSSDTGKWVVKNGDYMLPEHDIHPFRPSWGFEFDGRLFWVECSVGMITWDVEGDIFMEAETEEKANCRLIPLPQGREALYTTVDMTTERSFGGVAGGKSVQYVELFKESDCMLHCWRLKDYRDVVPEWSLFYKVSRVDVEKYLGFDVVNFDKVTILSLHPSFDPDSAVLCSEDITVFTLNFRTRKVESCTNSTGLLQCIPLLVPRLPVSIPVRLYAAYSKEHGNASFEEGQFTEAIEYYTDSIDFSPNVVAYANRAMAYLKLNRFSNAEDDCTEALEIDSNYYKAYARRAVARKELGNLEGALEDEEFALKLEPSNQDVKNLYSDVKFLLDKRSSAKGDSDMDLMN